MSPFLGNEFVQTKSVSVYRAPDFHKDNKTHVPMRVATDKQAARGKWQTVYVMHRNQHIESYEIFTEEKDGDVGEGKGEEGKLEEGEVQEEIKMK